jgi:hypothetical protein
VTVAKPLDVRGIEPRSRGEIAMRAGLYIQRIVALAVLAAWSVAVNLRERVAPGDSVRSVAARTPTSTHAHPTHDDRLRWN